MKKEGNHKARWHLYQCKTAADHQITRENKYKRGERMQDFLKSSTTQTLRSYTLPVLPQFLDIFILSCQWAIGCNHCLEVQNTNVEVICTPVCFKAEEGTQRGKLQNLHLEQQVSNSGFQEGLSLLITAMERSFSNQVILLPLYFLFFFFFK